MPGVLAAAGALAAGVTASPVLLTGYGTLWPNALATALLPACLALLADLLDLGPQRRRAARRSAGHCWPRRPSGSAWPTPTPSCRCWSSAWPRSSSAGGRVDGGRASCRSTAAAVVAWVVLLSPAFDAQRGTSWPARQRLPQALGEWLALAPQRVPVPAIVAGLALAGCVVAAVRPGLRWLLAVHLTGGALFVLVAGSDGPVSRMVSAAVVGRPVPAGGPRRPRRGAAGRDRARCRRPLGRGPIPWPAGSARPTAVPPRWRPRPPPCSVVAGTVSGSSDTTRVVATWYRPDSMLTPSEDAFVGTIGAVVPVGERVVGNPWDGAALSGPLAGREAVFPHLVGHWGTDRDLLASSLASVASAPEVCAALDRLHVRYVLVGPSGFWSDDSRRARYAGLAVAGRPGSRRSPLRGGCRSGGSRPATRAPSQP